MNEATMIEPAMARPVPAGILTGEGEPERDDPMASPASADVTAGRDTPATDGATVNGSPMDGVSMDGAPVEGAPMEGAPVEGVSMDKPPLGEPPVNEAGERTYAVQLTDEEWEEQRAFVSEYIPAITRDRKRAEDLQRKIIFPSFILKALKGLHGANFIRKEGYNTVDADLVYGPGWLDEDDDGPMIPLEGY